MWSHLKLILGKAELKRGRYAERASVPATPEGGRGSDGGDSSSWENVVRGERRSSWANLPRARGEETQSYISLCSLFTGCGVVPQRYRGQSGATPGQGAGSEEARWEGLSPDRLNGSRQPGLVFVRIPRHVRIRTAERRLNQYISLNGESIDSSVVSEEKPITFECFRVSRASGLFRFTQRLITKPIPPICGLVVSAGEPINLDAHMCAWGGLERGLKGQRWSHRSSWSPWNRHSFGSRRSTDDSYLGKVTWWLITPLGGTLILLLKMILKVTK